MESEVVDLDCVIAVVESVCFDVTAREKEAERAKMFRR